jgi:hypothetical protein
MNWFFVRGERSLDFLVLFYQEKSTEEKGKEKRCKTSIYVGILKSEIVKS